MTDTQTSPDTPAEKDAPPAVELPWADVHAEHHKMLRLAPLKTDRNTGGRPPTAARPLVERLFQQWCRVKSGYQS